MTDGGGQWDVREITTADTYPLRLAVLRAHTVSKEVSFHGDDLPGTFHLGAFDGDDLAAVSTWMPRPLATRPSLSAVQLRGMATLPGHQGRGAGAALLRAGCARARAEGCSIVWANARDAALRFYEANGFIAEGDGFVEPITGLPHHVVVAPA